jgi:hypothetical protein
MSECTRFPARAYRAGAGFPRPADVPGRTGRAVVPERSGWGALTTVAANDLVRPLHDHMPAVMPAEDFAAWLDPRARDPAKLLLLRLYPAERMLRWPVDRRVNSVRVDEPPKSSCRAAPPAGAVQRGPAA